MDDFESVVGDGSERVVASGVVAPEARDHACALTDVDGGLDALRADIKTAIDEELIERARCDEGGHSHAFQRRAPPPTDRISSADGCGVSPRARARASSLSSALSRALMRWDSRLKTAICVRVQVTRKRAFRFVLSLGLTLAALVVRRRHPVLLCGALRAGRPPNAIPGRTSGVRQRGASQGAFHSSHPSWSCVRSRVPASHWLGQAL